jgi:hypothetical protein
MLMAVAAATLLVLPNLLADEPSGSNEGQDGGMWAWRASKRYWELHGLAGRDPGKTCDDWSLPPWFVDVSQDDYLTECSDIRSNLKVPRPDLCCLSSYAKIILCLFSGTDGIHAGTHRGKGQQSLHPHNLSTIGYAGHKFLETLPTCNPIRALAGNFCQYALLRAQGGCRAWREVRVQLIHL